MLNEHKFDLEERTARFAESVIETARKIKITPVNTRIIEQLVGCAGSTAANYYEATEAESKKDFNHKIGITKKEVKESKLWLRLLAKAEPDKAPELRKLWQEAHELLLIFSKTLSSSKNRKIES